MKKTIQILCAMLIIALAAVFGILLVPGGEEVPISAALFTEAELFDGEMHTNLRGLCKYNEELTVPDPEFQRKVAALLLQAEPFRPYVHAFDTVDQKLRPEYSASFRTEQAVYVFAFYHFDEQLSMDYAYRDEPVILVQKTELLAPGQVVDSRVRGPVWEWYCKLPAHSYGQLLDLLFWYRDGELTDAFIYWDYQSRR